MQELPGGIRRLTFPLPLGIRRTASTKLLQTRRANSIVGQARIGARTVASVAWCVEDNHGGSVVTLRATIDSAGPIDRVVLLLGGHRWLARRFRGGAGAALRPARLKSLPLIRRADRARRVSRYGLVPGG